MVQSLTKMISSKKPLLFFLFSCIFNITSLTTIDFLTISFNSAISWFYFFIIADRANNISKISPICTFTSAFPDKACAVFLMGKPTNKLALCLRFGFCLWKTGLFWSEGIKIGKLGTEFGLSGAINSRIDGGLTC